MKLRKWEDIKRSRLDPERAERVASRVNAELVTMNLADLRQDLGLTQVEVAAAAEMTQSALSKIEKRKDVLVSTLERAVRALGGELEVVAVIKGRRVRLTV